MAYILNRRVSLKEIGDCKAVSGENVARQHWTLVCRMTLDVKKRKRVKAETRTKWWKLKKEECCAVVSSGRSRDILWVEGKSYQMTGKIQLKW